MKAVKAIYHNGGLKFAESVAVSGPIEVIVVFPGNGLDHIKSTMEAAVRDELDREVGGEDSSPDDPGRPRRSSDQTAGACQGEPLVRAEQGDYPSREELR